MKRSSATHYSVATLALRDKRQRRRVKGVEHLDNLRGSTAKAPQPSAPTRCRQRGHQAAGHEARAIKAHDVTKHPTDSAHPMMGVRNQNLTAKHRYETDTSTERGTHTAARCAKPTLLAPMTSTKAPKASIPTLWLRLKPTQDSHMSVRFVIRRRDLAMALGSSASDGDKPFKSVTARGVTTA